MRLFVLVIFGQWYKNLFVFLGLYPHPPRLVHNVCGLVCIFDYLKWVFASFFLSVLGGEDRGIPASGCVSCFVLLNRHWGIITVPGFLESEPRGYASMIEFRRHPSSPCTLSFFPFLGGTPNLKTGLKSQTLSLCIRLSQLLLVL